MNPLKKVGSKIADGISKLAVLSPNQIKELDNKRNEYLSEKPNMNSETTKELIERNLGAIGIEVYQAYLSQLKSAYMPVLNEDVFDVDNRIAFFNITRWVFDKEENGIEKLINVYNVLNKEKCSIALIFERKVNECNIYFGVVNMDPNSNDPAIVNNYSTRLQDALIGNFPGVSIEKSEFSPLERINSLISNDEIPSVCAISNIASEKSENFILQGIEKLLDSVNPSCENDEYRLLLLATPINNQLEEKARLEALMTAISPYESWQKNYMNTESTSQGSSATVSVNLGVSAGVQGGTSVGGGTQTGFTDQTGTNSSSPAEGGKGWSITPFGIGKSGTTEGTNSCHSTSNQTSTNFQSNNNYNATANFGVSFSRASTVNVSVGKYEGIVQTYTNHNVKNAIETLKEQIKRIDESSALGMWNFAAYSISANSSIASNVANIYLSLTQGEKSYLSNSSLNLWSGDVDCDEAKVICDYLLKMQHPIFGRKPSLPESWNLYPTIVTPTTIISGKELAMSLNMPRKSIVGIPVLESVSFGREPHMINVKTQLDTEVGFAYHMRKTIESQKISISSNELTKHLFVSGSTGSGKTNAVCVLLNQIPSTTKFLIIEPAKGEYKTHLKNWKDVTTYGTNPNTNSMLQINPFKFDSNNIHILEHLDRLVEIFNVCWPMYAAMPAILKDSIERAYIQSGWDLLESKNKYGYNLFPSFSDVYKQVKLVLEESDYSDENKGDYTGALVTRIKSLTNGINGLIFTNSEIEEELYFENNTIIDLSRIGSSETKSLIMALLVLKLQEYHLGHEDFSNKLKHITVLEEAHSILKKTSTEYSNETSNMVGKSVEMLTNAIAEMRAYGESFIIVDQSPALLDPAVIRNTNTKIILRLPSHEDREIVGKSSGLSEKQIEELVRLECGVASIFQSDWIETVLTKFFNFENLNRDVKTSNNYIINKTVKIDIVSLCKNIIQTEIIDKSDNVAVINLDEIVNSGLSGIAKASIFDYINSNSENRYLNFKKVIFELSNFEEVARMIKDKTNSIEWANCVLQNTILEQLKFEHEIKNKIICFLLDELFTRHQNYEKQFVEYIENQKLKGGEL